MEWFESQSSENLLVITAGAGALLLGLGLLMFVRGYRRPGQGTFKLYHQSTHKKLLRFLWLIEGRKCDIVNKTVTIVIEHTRSLLSMFII